MNAQQAGRIRRGGGQQVLSIDFASAEDELAIQAPGVPEAEDFFQREFVRALFDRAVTALRQDCVARGREIHWRLFERCDLRRDGHPSYADLAAAFDLTPGQVTGYLAQARVPGAHDRRVEGTVRQRGRIPARGARPARAGG